jgi:hypothetical protein
VTKYAKSLATMQEADSVALDALLEDFPPHIGVRAGRKKEQKSASSSLSTHPLLMPLLLAPTLSAGEYKVSGGEVEGEWTGVGLPRNPRARR